MSGTYIRTAAHHARLSEPRLYRRRQIIGVPFGHLIPRRTLDDIGDLFDAICDCGNWRTVTRRQLTSKAIASCRQCADRNNRTSYRGLEIVEDLQPPSPMLQCNGPIIDGWQRCDWTKCPLHRTTWPGQRVDSHLNGQSVEME